jgi:glycerol transport system ATP-binding protein
MMVIYSTAEPLEALDMASHTIVMNQGRVQQDGPALDMYSKPKNIPVAQAMSDPPLNLISSTTSSVGAESLGNALKDKHAGAFTLGVRPHNIALKSKNAADIAVSGKVRIAENTGSSTYLHLDLSDSQKLVLEVEGSQHFDVGSNMTVYLDRDALFGFDTASGNTLFTPVGVK